MTIIGYGLIGVALIAGYFRLPVPVVLVLALISTFVFAKARRESVKDEGLKNNAVIDGAYLLFGQALIMFSAYAFGYFLIMTFG